MGMLVLMIFRHWEEDKKANKEIYKVSARYIQEVLLVTGRKEQVSKIRTMSGG